MSPNSRVTEAQKVKIIRLRKQGLSLTVIALRFDLSVTAIKRITERKRDDEAAHGKAE